MVRPVAVLSGAIVPALAGVLAGLAAGLFGVGGGVVMVPVLHYGLGVDFVLATQISLLVIAVNTPVGLWRQQRHGNVRWDRGAILALGGVVGVAVAKALRLFIPVLAFKGLFALVALYAAIRIFRPAKVEPHEASRWWLLPAGVLGGAAAHWLGIGGGLLMVPILVLLGTRIHYAVATSLVAVFSNAFVSTLFDLPRLVHHLDVAVPLAVGAVVGIQSGVKMANKTTAGRLQRGFAVFLLAMALYVLGDTLASL